MKERMKRPEHFFIKTSLFLYCPKKVEMAVSVRVRDRDKDEGVGLLSLTPHWIYIQNLNSSAS